MEMTTKQAGIYTGLIVLSIAIICYIVPKVLSILLIIIAIISSVVLVGGLAYFIVRYFMK